VAPVRKIATKAALTLNWILLLVGLLSVIALASRGGQSLIGLLTLAPFAAAIASFQLFPSRTMAAAACLLNLALAAIVGIFVVAAMSISNDWFARGEIVLWTIALVHLVAALTNSVLAFLIAVQKNIHPGANERSVA
jgi:hypothetical protein